MLTPKEGAAQDLDPVFLVRAPEMGLQPQMTFLGLRTMLTELADGADDVIVSQIASGGAIQLSVLPGEVSDIGGCLYIGIELF